MSELLSWSLSAGAPSGVGVNQSGSVETEAITTATVDLEAAMAAAKDLALQVDDVTKVDFLIVTCTLNDGKVEVQADGAAATPLTGPLVLFGGAVGLFAGDLDKLSVQNKSPTTAAKLSILIGLQLA